MSLSEAAEGILDLIRGYEEARQREARRVRRLAIARARLRMDLYAADVLRNFDPGQLRDPHTGEWIDGPGTLSDVTDLLAGLTVTEIDPDRVQTWNDVDDHGKYASLVESMSSHGWQGAPVVVIPGVDHGWGEGDPHAVTGSHRIAAAREAGIDVPTVQLDDILHEHGTSLAELDEAYGVDPQEDPSHMEAVRRLDEVLPSEVVDFFGFDAH